MSAVAYATVLLRALALTVAIEVLLARAVCGVVDARGLRAVALAQVVTNPLVNVGAMLVGWNPALPIASWPWLVVAMLEVAAVVVEALLYRAAGTSPHPWRVSVVLNTSSFALGLVLAVL